MRLTRILWKQHIGWRSDMLWRQQQTIKKPSLYKPKFLEEQGVEVVDPNKVYAPKQEYWSPPVPDDPRWILEPTIEDHPHYHEEPIKAFFHDTKLQYGLQQASILSKTQIFQGFPNTVQRLVGQHPIKMQDDLVRQYIMQAHVWDSTWEILPRRFNPDLPRWKFKPEMGIPKHKITRFLTDHLIRLTMSLSARHPQLLSQRVITPEPLLETYLQYNEKTIQIKAQPMYLISTNQELAPFGDETLLDESCNHQLDDLSPVLPTVDLKKSHVYTLQDSSAFKAYQKLGHPHTLILNNANDNIVRDKFDLRKMWSTEHRHARALMLCLAMTTQQARLKYGNDVTTLSQPISMQCVHHDGIYFNFLFFQLNTLNLSSPDGVKNFAWVDSDNRMFEKIEPKRAMLRNTKYQNYDPMVYDKFRATFLHGLELPDSSEEFEPDDQRRLVTAQEVPLEASG